MSLICDGTGKYIDFGKPLYAGTRGDVAFYSALCQEALASIPESERRSEPCGPEDDGVDIHEASSDKNFNDAYTLTGFTLGNFLFSISREALERYLPRHAKKYPRP